MSQTKQCLLPHLLKRKFRDVDDAVAGQIQRAIRWGRFIASRPPSGCRFSCGSSEPATLAKATPTPGFYIARSYAHFLWCFPKYITNPQTIPNKRVRPRSEARKRAETIVVLVLNHWVVPCVRKALLYTMQGVLLANQMEEVEQNITVHTCKWT